MSNSWPELMGIGAAVHDTLIVVAEYPLEDTKLETLETKIQGGGPCATALVAAHKLGVPAAYMGRIGADAFGRSILEEFSALGMQTRFVRTAMNEVSFHSVVLLNQATGSRTCLWNRGTVAALAPREVDLQALGHAKVLHLDGHMLEAALHAAKFCRSNGILVSYDAGGAYCGVENLMPYTDWLIPSEEFAIKVTREPTAQAAARKLYALYHPQLVVVTQGAKGGVLLDEKGLRRYESYPVEVKDTNGCGDIFHGAFIAAKLKNMANDAACRYASAAAALKCTRLGARSAMPSHEECLSFLAQRGVAL